MCRRWGILCELSCVGFRCFLFFALFFFFFLKKKKENREKNWYDTGTVLGWMFLIGDADHGMMKQKGEILRDLHRRESGEYSEVGEPW